MRRARACATVGARLTPRAPRPPNAAVTPPESRTKSRLDNEARKRDGESPVRSEAGAAIGVRRTSIKQCNHPLSWGIETPYTRSRTSRKAERAGRNPMFKKSEEQEWTRFRGALSKDRDETGAAPTVPDASDPTTGTTSGPPVTGQPTSTGPSYRSSG